MRSMRSDALADPGELGGRVAVGGIDADLQRRQFHPRLHDVFLERLDFIQVLFAPPQPRERTGSSQTVGCERSGHAAERRRQRE